MNGNQIEVLMNRMANTFIECYAGYVNQQVPKALVVAAMSGALAACAKEANVPKDNLMNSLKSAVDDIEAGG